MIIEELDPRGSRARFGSLSSLAQELADIRDVIARDHRAATVWTSNQATIREDCVAAAWQGSDVMQRMCSIALAHRLPMLIVG
jgi:hypothetical protein